MRVTGAYLSSSLGLCQNGRCLHRHWQMEKVEEQIFSWRIVVLCAETSTEPRLCARTFQYMLCMASSVRRGVSPATPLRTGFISRDAVSDGLRYRFLAGGRNDITCHHRRSLSPVTIDVAAGGVKDLVYRTVSQLWSRPREQILCFAPLDRARVLRMTGKAFCFSSFASLRMTENRYFRMTVCIVLYHSDFQPWARRGSSTPSGVTRTAPTSGRARWPMMSNVWKSWRKRSCFPIGTV